MRFIKNTYIPTAYNKDLIGQSLWEFLSTIVDKIACRYVHGKSRHAAGEGTYYNDVIALNIAVT